MLLYFNHTVQRHQKYFDMINMTKWVFATLIICACTCGARSECSDEKKLSVILNLNSKVCDQILYNINSFQESDLQLVLSSNVTYDGLNIEVAMFDTCGSEIGTVKAVLKTLLWADIKCLQPPFFLGFIGPDTTENLKVASKITSPLEIPHIINFTSTSLYSHYFISTHFQLVSKGILKLVELLKWKSFVLKNNSKNKFLENIESEILTEADLRNLCVVNTQDAADYLIYIGDMDDDYISHIRNATIIIVSDRNLGKKLNDVDESNSLLVIDNIRSEQWINFNLDHVKWSQVPTKLIHDTTKLHFFNTAIQIYAKALNSFCKLNNCRSNKTTELWNNLIDKYLRWNNESSEKKSIFFKLKEKLGDFRNFGKINFEEDEVHIFWNNKRIDLKSINEPHDQLIALKNFIFNKTGVRCLNNTRNVKVSVDDFLGRERNNIIISEMSDGEWWSMIATVTGVGIAMFTIGFIAVYIVYTNIRGPRSSKINGKYDIDRDSSLRRIDSDRRHSSGRNSRAINSLQRRDSRSSIRSNVSEKSI